MLYYHKSVIKAKNSYLRGLLPDSKCLVGETAYPFSYSSPKTNFISTWFIILTFADVIQWAEHLFIV